jgi:hypothetical protein
MRKANFHHKPDSCLPLPAGNRSLPTPGKCAISSESLPFKKLRRFCPVHKGGQGRRKWRREEKNNLVVAGYGGE